jgi:hypothetical protein
MQRDFSPSLLLQRQLLRVSSQNLEIQFEKPTPASCVGARQNLTMSFRCGLTIRPRFGKRSSRALFDGSSRVGPPHASLEIKRKNPLQGAGGQKSGIFDWRPYGYLAQIPADFENFFLPPAQTIPR